MFFIFIYSMILILLVVKLLQHFHVCQLGFHEKRKTGSYLDIMEYIKEQKEIIRYRVFEERIGERNTTDFLYRVINNFPHDKVYNEVCLKCGKCYHNVNDTKKAVDKFLWKFYEEEKKELNKDVLADKIFLNNCKKKEEKYD